MQLTRCSTSVETATALDRGVTSVCFFGVSETAGAGGGRFLPVLTRSTSTLSGRFSGLGGGSSHLGSIRSARSARSRLTW